MQDLRQAHFHSHFHNLAEGIHKITCKDFDCFLEYENASENLIKCKCLSYNKKKFKQNWWRIRKEIQEHIEVFQQWY